MRLVLASSSLRRAELLRAAGFTFDVVISDVDERVRAGEAPADYVRRLAAEKSAAVFAALKRCATAVAETAWSSGDTSGRQAAQGSDDASLSSVAQGPEGMLLSRVAQGFSPAWVILGADTAVVVDGAVLGKPRDDAEAGDMLRRLSGRWHEVMTGVSLRSGEVEVGHVESTRVQFASLSKGDVDWYVGTGEGRDKAGAYAIQGLASRFIPRIEGSYSNVVGLPIPAVVNLLPEIRRRTTEAG